jgi:hypothetical protein
MRGGDAAREDKMVTSHFDLDNATINKWLDNIAKHFDVPRYDVWMLKERGNEWAPGMREHVYIPRVRGRLVFEHVAVACKP